MIDPISESQSNLLVVTFLKTGSQFYPVAVELARLSSKYDEGTLGGKPFHAAIFGRDPEQARRALDLLRYTETWKGKRIYGRGRGISRWEAGRVLECYVRASACADYRAHCFRVIDDPNFREEGKRFTGNTVSIPIPLGDLFGDSEGEPRPQPDKFLFPCSYLYGHFRWQDGHPAGPQAQIQAKAVEEAIDICPYFNPDNYKRLDHPERGEP